METRAAGTTRAVRLASGAVLSALTVAEACANPRGGVVMGGSATITASPGVTTVEQHSSKAIIDWKDFSIGAGELTRFVQPGADAIALNRVTGGSRSELLGRLEANGSVWVINPNGVLIGPNARVDANGFMATTADIADDDFLAGRFRFTVPSPKVNAAVVNEGTVTIGETGLAVLVAPEVRNDGTIVAKLGQVVLGGAPTFTMDFQGDGLVQFALGGRVADPAGTLVSNAGEILADGGHVTITASAAADVVGDVIRMDGIVQARGVTVDGGEIVLDGGDAGTVRVAGTLDASSGEGTGRGGTVDVLGRAVALEAGARVDVSGDAGGGSARIGGGRHGDGSVRSALSTSVADGAFVDADARRSGDGGDVVVWADDETRFAGRITARGGTDGGDGGSAEVSARRDLRFSGRVDLTAPAGVTGTLLLDPRNIVVGGPDATIDPGTIEANLQKADVILATGGDPREAGDGDILVLAGITAPAGENGLFLHADRDILLNAGIDMSASSGPLELIAGSGRISSHGEGATGALRPGSGTVGLTAEGSIDIDLDGGVATIDAFSASGDIRISEADPNRTISAVRFTGIEAQSGGILVAVNGDIDVAGSVFAATDDGAPQLEDVRHGTVSLFTGAFSAGTGSITIDPFGWINGRDVQLRSARDVAIAGYVTTLEPFFGIVPGGSVGITAARDVLDGTTAIGFPTGGIITSQFSVTGGAETRSVALLGYNQVDSLTMDAGAGDLLFRNYGDLAVQAVRGRTVGLYVDGVLTIAGPGGSIAATLEGDQARQYDFVDRYMADGRRIACQDATICVGTRGFSDRADVFGLDPASSDPSKKAGRFLVYSSVPPDRGGDLIGAYARGNPSSPNIGNRTRSANDGDSLEDGVNYFLYPPGTSGPTGDLPTAALPVVWFPPLTPVVADLGEAPTLWIAYRPTVPASDAEDLSALDGNERLWR